MITPDFDYTIIAKCFFQDIGGGNWRVDILKKGILTNPPVIKEYTATGTPLRFSMLSGNLTDPIKTSEAIIDLFNMSDFDAIKFFSTNNRQHRANIYKDSVLYWSGYIQSDIWNEPFTTTPYPSTITFIDGLSMLKNIDFKMENGQIWHGYGTPISLIAIMLAPLRLGRDIVDCLNYTFDETSFTYWPTQAYKRHSFLAQTRINTHMLEGMTCYEALETLLSSFCARIEYYNNKYWIKPLKNYGDFYCTEYDYEGNYKSAYYLNALQNITKPTEPIETRVCWVDGDQQLDLMPGWKSFDLVRKRMKRESMFWPWKFDEDAWTDADTMRNTYLEACQKAVVEGVTCLEMPAREQGVVVDDGLIRQYVNEWYVYEEAAMINLDVSFRIGTLKPTENRNAEYYGPRGGTASGTGNVYKSSPQAYRGAKLQCIVSPSAPPYSYATFTMLKRGLTTDFSSEGINFIVFTNPNILPTGIKAGKFYSVIELTTSNNGLAYFFKLSDYPSTTNIYTPVFADVSSDGENAIDYDVVVIPNAHLLEFINFDNSANSKHLNIEGAWSNSDYLMMQIDTGLFNDKKFSTLGVTTVETAPYSGRFQMDIRKPYPVQFFHETGRVPVRGSIYFDQVTATLSTALEDYTEKVVIDSDMNIEQGEIVQNVCTMEVDGVLELNPALKYKNAILLDVPQSYFYDYQKAIIPALRLKTYDPETLVFSSVVTTLNGLFKDYFVKQYSRPRYLLTGALNSETIDILNKVFYERFTQKIYLPISFDYDVKMCKFTNELHEIGLPEYDANVGEFNNDFDNINEFA